MTGARARWRRRPARTTVLAVSATVLAVVAVLGFRALVVLASVGPRAEYWAERSRQPGDVVQVALGDSLTQGVGSSRPGTSYVAVLADDLAERTGGSVRVVNLSVTGATTEDLVEDQLPQLRRLLDELAEDGTPVGLVTLCIGSNDAGRTTPEQYRNRLATALDAVPPGTYVTDVPDFNGGPRLEAAAALSRVAREEVRERPDLVLVPLEDYTADLGLRDYAADLFHPSDAGYERYVAAFRDAIAGSPPEPFVPAGTP